MSGILKLDPPAGIDTTALLHEYLRAKWLLFGAEDGHGWPWVSGWVEDVVWSRLAVLQGPFIVYLSGHDRISDTRQYAAYITPCVRLVNTQNDPFSHLKFMIVAGPVDGRVLNGVSSLLVEDAAGMLERRLKGEKMGAFGKFIRDSLEKMRKIEKSRKKSSKNGFGIGG